MSTSLLRLRYHPNSIVVNSSNRGIKCSSSYIDIDGFTNWYISETNQCSLVTSSQIFCLPTSRCYHGRRLSKVNKGMIKFNRNKITEQFRPQLYKCEITDVFLFTDCLLHRWNMYQIFIYITI